MSKIKSQHGFTLIETLLYIGLFTLVMSAILIATHQLIESTQKTQIKAHVEGEARFILFKIDEALNGATNVSESGGVLTITNPSLPGGQSPVVIALDPSSDAVTFKRGSLNPMKLNGAIAPVTNISFVITSTGTAQKTVQTTFEVTSPLLNEAQEYTSTRAIRKVIP